MGEMKKINVRLYGGKSIFGGREDPLAADEIYCDRSDECTFYRDGKCLECRQPFSSGCRFGKTTTIRGYTSRAAKYYTFKRKYEDDPVYKKLSYPSTLAARIGDMVYLNPKYVWVRKYDEHKDFPYQAVDGYIVSGSDIGSNAFFIQYDDITNKLLHQILTYNPRSFFGETIKNYKEKVVPELMQDMKRALPEIHKRFIEEYPEFDMEPNYVGKNVFVCSLKPGTVFKDHHGEEWKYDGEYVETVKEVDLSFGSPWYMEGAKCGMARIKVNDKMTVMISDNSQVDENTRFA